MEKTEPNRWKFILPEGQKCQRELDRGYLPEKCSDAVLDYNGMGYFVCIRCNGTLNEQFDNEGYKE